MFIVRPYIALIGDKIHIHNTTFSIRGIIISKKSSIPTSRKSNRTDNIHVLKFEYAPSLIISFIFRNLCIILM